MLLLVGAKKKFGLVLSVGREREKGWGRFWLDSDQINVLAASGARNELSKRAKRRS